MPTSSQDSPTVPHIPLSLGHLSSSPIAGPRPSTSKTKSISLGGGVGGVGGAVGVLGVCWGGGDVLERWGCAGVLGVYWCAGGVLLCWGCAGVLGGCAGVLGSHPHTLISRGFLPCCIHVAAGWTEHWAVEPGSNPSRRQTTAPEPFDKDAGGLGCPGWM